MARKRPVEHWKDEPDKHDYAAAEDYLNLVMPVTAAKKTARRLRTAPLTRRKAKDLLRASQLPMLAPDNIHVVNDLKKVKGGDHLSRSCWSGAAWEPASRSRSPMATTGSAPATTWTRMRISLVASSTPSRDGPTGIARTRGGGLIHKNPL